MSKYRLRHNVGSGQRFKPGRKAKKTMTRLQSKPNPGDWVWIDEKGPFKCIEGAEFQSPMPRAPRYQADLIKSRLMPIVDKMHLNILEEMDNLVRGYHKWMSDFSDFETLELVTQYHGFVDAAFPACFLDANASKDYYVNAAVYVELLKDCVRRLAIESVFEKEIEYEREEGE